jgi:prepilin-type N-terminal cleavage/methylation domain-containing protein
MRIVSPASANQRGFTLAELLVAFAVVGLIMAGSVTLMVSGNKTYATGSNQIEAQQAARVALERMAREIRGAGYSPKSLACPPTNNCPIVGVGFGSPNATSLQIQSDLNGDGNFNAAGEVVVYTKNGTLLQRQDLAVDAAPQTIIAGVQALTFTYLDENGGAAGQPKDIRSVQIQLTAQPENLPGTWELGRVSVTMSDRIRLRNR